jgi:hypothetical protein
MADWRKLVQAVLLADGKIDENEVKVLKKELWADGKITEDERDFLVELRNMAQKKAKAKKEEVNPAFEKLFIQAIEDHVLEDGKISAEEVKWLRNMMMADKKIDAYEKKLLASLNKKAKEKDPSFDAMYNEFKDK